MPELPVVGDGFFGCPPMFANVRFVLAGRLDRSPLSARDCCQSSALLSTLLSIGIDYNAFEQLRSTTVIICNFQLFTITSKQVLNRQL